MNPRQLTLIPPVKHTGLSISDRKKNAAGIPAVINSIAHLREETGVIDGIKILSRMNQKGGFDCPGCAWPDPLERSRLGEYCENGVKALAEEATTRRVDREFFAKHSVEELSNWSDYELGKSGRITEPFILRKGSSHYESIGWSEAITSIAEKLNSLASPNEALFYTSGRASNEAAYLYQLFVRWFGTNNLPDCSNMCHESSGVGLSATIGIGKGTVTLEDIHIAKLILVIGQNPGTNHPRMLSALQQCRANRGRIIEINPIPEAGTAQFINPQHVSAVIGGGMKLSERHIPVRTSMDVALLKGVMKLLIEKDDAAPGSGIDQKYIQENTEGFGELIADLRNVDPDAMAAISGVTIEDLHFLSDAIASTDSIIVCWAMGLTQHVHAVANVHQIVNLLLMRGAFGKPGAGACPVRGHSNVQGDRTVGIYEKPTEAFMAALDKRYGFSAPRAHGFDTVDSIEAMRDGRAKVFFALGGNFISATPDSEVTARALMNCDLTVQASTKLNRSHVITGEEAIILPCLGRSERDLQKGRPQFVSVENSMGVVHRSQGTHEPAAPHLKSEVAIVCGLAAETLKGRSEFPWLEMVNNYDLIRDEIEAVIPGFERYNQRVRQPDGFYLPNGPREGKFTTSNGKAQFRVDPTPQWPIREGEYMMMTIRSHDQFNTTIYGLDDRYRGIHNERRVVFMSRADMRSAGLKEKQRVDLISSYDRERKAEDFFVIPYDIAPGCVATYFPEANVLVPLQLKAHKSGTPASKSVVIRVRPK